MCLFPSAFGPDTFVQLFHCHFVRDVLETETGVWYAYPVYNNQYV